MGKESPQAAGTHVGEPTCALERRKTEEETGLGVNPFTTTEDNQHGWGSRQSWAALGIETKQNGHPIGGRKRMNAEK